MKKYSTPLLFCLFFLFNSFRIGGGNNAFLSVVEQAGMKFVQPANTIETKIIANDELNYQYALKDTVNKIEIRYLIFPLQELVKKYNSTSQDTTTQPKFDPNLIHTNLLLKFAYVVQGKEMNFQEMPAITEIPHATIEIEYNGDWGAFTTSQPCDEFAQKYKYCTIFAIHKDNVADAYIIYLYDDKERFDDAVKPDYHSLLFKKG